MVGKCGFMPFQRVLVQCWKQIKQIKPGLRVTLSW